MLKDKLVVVGISGGIAAYKVVDLVSSLVKAKAGVHVMMTVAARNFIGPSTFYAITGNRVYDDLFSPHAGPVPHIELAGRASIMVIAPATANIIGKIAHGLADDLLSTTVLAATCPVLICPAMNVNMFRNPTVQDNIKRLKDLGYLFVEPGVGRLACGYEGEGRLAEPREIFERIAGILSDARDMEGVRVMVTAGGTREPIDPVRFISNRSSGKMGYALAQAAAARGAEVTLVSAPVALEAPSGVSVIAVETAVEMYHAVMNNFASVDIVIKAAAVTDYRPRIAAEHKIKRGGVKPVVELEENPDILKELGNRKRSQQVLIGFAAETQDLEENAMEKVRKKNLDFLVANDVTQEGAGFGTDTNIVSLIHSDGSTVSLPIMKKRDLAGIILDEALKVFHSKHGAFVG